MATIKGNPEALRAYRQRKAAARERKADQKQPVKRTAPAK